jgi:hypothetical protein
VNPREDRARVSAELLHRWLNVATLERNRVVLPSAFTTLINPPPDLIRLRCHKSGKGLNKSREFFRIIADRLETLLDSINFIVVDLDASPADTWALDGQEVVTVTDTQSELNAGGTFAMKKLLWAHHINPTT